MAMTVRQPANVRTMSDVLKRHLSALGGLFTQMLQLCQKDGSVCLVHVAVDGLKIRANAFTCKVMSYGLWIMQGRFVSLASLDRLTDTM